MIDRLVPDWVAVSEARFDTGEEGLFPAEIEVIGTAVAKRRAEFSTVRQCARRALGRLGVPPVPILPGPRGAPQWPAEIVGSMTHCAGFRAAAVARAGQVAGIGIDAEPHEPLPDGVLKLVARDEELVQLAELGSRHPHVHWDRLLFTIKESVYKTWFPITGEWLDFSGASVRIDAASQSFTARLTVPSPIRCNIELAAFHGRFCVADGLVASAIVLPAERRLSASATIG
jgi:4'-phosphopantetheinyl transferase EntD